MSNRQTLLVLPEIFEVPWIWRRDLLSPAARQMARALTRHGGEFWGIRQHEPGDDLRHVHWKVTAHKGDLVVKEYARGRELAAALWLDLNAANVVGEGALSSLEMCIIMTASLLPALLAMDQAVALVGEGLPASLRVPGRGEATAIRVLRTLAEAQATNGRPFTEVVAEQAAAAQPGLTAVVVTSGVEPGLPQALLTAASRGVALRCLALAPVEALTEQQRARQAQLVSRLRHAGVPVVVGTSKRELPHTLGQLAMKDSAERAAAV